MNITYTQNGDYCLLYTSLHHFLGADTDEYTYEALKLFLMGAIRRVFRPGSKFEVMLCLCLLYTSRCV